MNWSNIALKGTIGVGALGMTAILTDLLDPHIGIWGIIILVLMPFTLLVFFRVDELPVWIIKIAHGIAVSWYFALFVGSVSYMALRGFISSDLLLGAFMALGLWPCVIIVRALVRGDYGEGEG